MPGVFADGCNKRRATGLGTVGGGHLGARPDSGICNYESGIHGWIHPG